MKKKFRKIVNNESGQMLLFVLVVMMLLLIIVLAIVVNIRTDIQAVQQEQNYEKGYAEAEDILLSINSRSFSSWKEQNVDSIYCWSTYAIPEGLESRYWDKAKNFCRLSDQNESLNMDECCLKTDLGDDGTGMAVVKTKLWHEIHDMSIGRDETIEVDLTGASGVLDVSWSGAPAMSAMLMCGESERLVEPYNPLLSTIEHVCQELTEQDRIDDTCRFTSFDVNIPNANDLALVLGITTRDGLTIRNISYVSGSSTYDLQSSGMVQRKPGSQQLLDIGTEMFYLLDPPAGSGTVYIESGETNDPSIHNRTILVFGTMWKDFESFNSFTKSSFTETGELEYYWFGTLPAIEGPPSITSISPTVTNKTILVDTVGFQSGGYPYVGPDQNEVWIRYPPSDPNEGLRHTGGMSWQSALYGDDMTWTSVKDWVDYWTMVVASFDLSEELTPEKLAGDVSAQYSNIRMTVCRQDENDDNICDDISASYSISGLETIKEAQNAGPFNLDICSDSGPILLRLRAIGEDASSIYVGGGNDLPPQMYESRVQSFSAGLELAEDVPAPEVHTLAMIRKRLPSIFDYVLFVANGDVDK